MEQHLERQLGQMEIRIENAEQSIDKLEEVIEKVRDRIPPWLALVMTGMGAIIGSLLTVMAKG